MRRIIKAIIDILTFLVFIVLIVIIIAKVKMMVKGEEYFELFGYSVFSVETGSMKPVIKENDIIVVKKYKNASYKVDDIITFKLKNDYITHRIVNINGDNLVTRGDANNTNDIENVNIKNVIGKVIKISSKAGIWHKVFTTPLIIVMIFVTLIMFDFAFSYKGFKNKKSIKIINKLQDVPFEEINKEKDSPKMSNDEIAILNEKKDKVINGEKVEFDKKEQEFLNYTVRLDLDELMNRINNNMNGDK